MISAEEAAVRKQVRTTLLSSLASVVEQVEVGSVAEATQAASTLTAVLGHGDLWEEGEFASAVKLADGLVAKVEGQPLAAADDVSAALGSVLSAVGNVLDATTGRMAVTAAVARDGGADDGFRSSVRETAALAVEVTGVVDRVVKAARALQQPGSPPLRIQGDAISVVAVSEHAEFANETSVRDATGEPLVDGVGQAVVASTRGLAASTVGVTVVKWKIDPRAASQAQDVDAADFA